MPSRAQEICLVKRDRTTVSVIDPPTKQRGTQGSPPKDQRTAVSVSLLRHPVSDLDRVFNEVLHPQLELMMREFLLWTAVDRDSH